MKQVFEDAGPVIAKLSPDPTQEEWDGLLPSDRYIYSVGHAIALLLTVLEQLEHSVLYISAFSTTPRMRRGGINRSKQIRYTIENYIIRTQSLYDRTLILVNEVYDLGNDYKTLNHTTIILNSKLDTETTERLKRLRKLLDNYREPRNIVVHRGSIRDELLFPIEAAEALNESGAETIPKVFTDRWKRRVIEKRSTEFREFNDAIAGKIDELATGFEPRYQLVKRIKRALFDRIAKTAP